METLSIDEVIEFHSETVTFELSYPNSTKKWLEAVAQQEGQGIAALSFIFCSDDYLLNMNVEYLNHDTLTDVITFQYSENDDEAIEGDIFISIERVAENATTFGVPFEKELQRVIVHGTLHLLGYGDKSKAEKELMTEKENFYLEQFTNY